MSHGCRDCVRCTETVFTWFWKMPFRIIAFVIWRAWIGFFVKHCPVCGHWLRKYHVMIGGRFQD